MKIISEIMKKSIMKKKEAINHPEGAEYQRS